MEQAGSTEQLAVQCKGGDFALISSPKPVPAKGQALIRVHYTTINPFDRASIKRKIEGFTLGGDGCGIVEAVGEEVSADLIGRKVAFTGQGWARYAVKEAKSLMLFDADFDLKKGASAYVNPLTASGLVDLALKHNAKAVIILAASSSLGRILNKLCKEKGLIPVNIVRREEHVKNMTETLGSEYVLNQTLPTFFTELEAVIAKTQPTAIFDCLGGELPGDIFTRMPYKSMMIEYGSLTGQRISIVPNEFHWSDKKLIGIVFFRWLAELPEAERQAWLNLVSDDIQHHEGKIFGSHVIKEVSLNDWREAAAESEKDASNGKFLVRVYDI